MALRKARLPERVDRERHLRGVFLLQGGEGGMWTKSPDQLLAAGTPIDATDDTYGLHPLRLAAQNGRVRSVRRLLELGADPDLRDERGRSPLDLCAGHTEAAAILRPLSEAP
jgi:ankyrin repeat protein